MEYSIQTLELEIARLRKAAREIRSIPFSAEDMSYGIRPDPDEMERRIQGLERAIVILREWVEEHSYEAEKFDRR